ncbi:MAG: TatD family hydrolase [Treponema sp.]|uniref:TatD family hydrolase n=1 Tax=Treponema sp. TaxID=166 RepID=UPI00298E5F63|nr:TatD family hydrolase [Treponema sp.]MBR5933984.1 TatD family hydrolase [Treponema sp.]
MFSDTHFHFSLASPENRGKILKTLAERDCFFGLDIGTHCDDLLNRQKLVKETACSLENEIQKKVFDYIYFSAGIWPAPEAIKNRFNEMVQLENQIKDAENSSDDFFKKICAVGECGLDHHWNPSGADGRSENDFDRELFFGEAEMFEMQLNLAKKFNLPVIVHSRDAFEGTLECIKNVSYDNGIIHCYSYGLEEAKAFLDRGWYLAFGGSVTYTKKAKMEQMKQLLRYVPKDRILLETDAPYLAPVPFRGQENTPLLIDNTYMFIAEILGLNPEELSLTVDNNIRRLFKL